MFVALVGHKGGVGKTTAAIHLAAALNQDAPTLLIDADPNRSALEWSKRGDLPFKVLGQNQAIRHIADHKHVVFDTKARLDHNELAELAEGVDLLIVPTSPDTLALHGMLVTLNELEKIGAKHYRILLSIVPPMPNRDGIQARITIEEQGLPVFDSQFRRFIAYQRAALRGLTVNQVRDAHAADAWRDVTTMAREALAA